MRLSGTIAAIGSLVVFVSVAHARPEYCEQGDTQDMTDGAQNAEGMGPLDAINGRLEGPPAAGKGDFGDMYVIEISDPANFRVRVVTGGGAKIQLWLFAGPDLTTFPEGVGLLGNNGQGLGFEGALLENASTDGTGIVLTEPGRYYLAMTGQAPRGQGGAGRVPQAKNPDAKDPPGLGDIFAFGPGFEISGPDGPSGGFPICAWAGEGDFGGYSAETEGCTLIEPCDLSDNGLVDFADLLVVLANWGPCPDPPLTCVLDEDFESFDTGLPLIPQQPCFPTCDPMFSWQPYDMQPGGGDALIVTDPDPTQSDKVLQIRTLDDIVHTFNGLDADTFVFRTDVYVPSSGGQQSFFRLENTYSSATNENVSLLLAITPFSNIEDLDDGEELPIVMDAWTELRVVIDLATDTQIVYYNDDILVVKSWTEGSTGGGALEVQGVRLTGQPVDSPGGGDAYYDDLSLCPRFGPPPCSGDLNLDNAVDFGDILQILAQWGQECD